MRMEVDHKARKDCMAKLKQLRILTTLGCSTKGPNIGNTETLFDQNNKLFEEIFFSKLGRGNLFFVDHQGEVNGQICQKWTLIK